MSRAAFEDGEQRPLVTGVNRVLTLHEPDVRRELGKPLPLDGAEVGED